MFTALLRKHIELSTVKQESRVYLQTSDAGQRETNVGPSILAAHAGHQRGQRVGIRELEMRVREVFPADADVFRKELGADFAPPATDAATFMQPILDEVAENLPQEVLVVAQVT